MYIIYLYVPCKSPIQEAEYHLDNDHWDGVELYKSESVWIVPGTVGVDD